jgi:hypothetical protein
MIKNCVYLKECFCFLLTHTPYYNIIKLYIYEYYYKKG